MREVSRLNTESSAPAGDAGEPSSPKVRQVSAVRAPYLSGGRGPQPTVTARLGGSPCRGLQVYIQHSPDKDTPSISFLSMSPIAQFRLAVFRDIDNQDRPRSI